MLFICLYTYNKKRDPLGLLLRIYLVFLDVSGTYRAHKATAAPTKITIRIVISIEREGKCPVNTIVIQGC